MGSTLAGLLISVLAIAGAVLLLIFVMVPLARGLGWVIASIFKGIGWLVAHLFEFVAGMIGDALRFVGAIIAMVLLVPLTLINVVIGRWSAAGHFSDSVKREFKVAGTCLYRVALRRPLRLLLLHGLLEGVEERVPEAMAAAPTSDRPRRRTGQFTGYRIVGSLRGGGSGAKLYIAEPDASVRAREPRMPDRVVIKSFALSEGSSLPQIVRESRALDSARQLGLVFDHGLDQHRFYYVMPYHAGDHLGIVTRQLHGETAGRGLERGQLATALAYVNDLVETLCVYHHGGLWHKDVKPENIIVHDGRAHLVDLGLVTPLRSAMTLTTHGTEYFRDPEMVRQALRGVKVHQVDGARFDIYAAGAVLYFMIENTFPAHGALSRFTRKSPEALRWVVRRAMADYAQRYESAPAMLADLRHVAEASDPYAVKPVDLPSMAGGDAAAAAFEAEDLAVAAVAAAGSPVPPPRPVEPPPAPAAAPVAAAGAAPVSPGRRPRLQVTNWWTGAYRVDDPGSAGPGPVPPPVAARPGPEARVARAHAAAFRHDAAELRRKVRTGEMSARKAAREQIRSARHRAREIQRRARAHRGRAVGERQPSRTLVGIGAAVLLLCAAGVFYMLTQARSSRGRAASITILAPEPVPVPTVTGPDAPRPSILVLPSLGDPDDEETVAQLDEIVEKYTHRGYDVIVNTELADPDLRALVTSWSGSDDEETDLALEDVLESLDLYGLLHVTESRDGAHGRLSVKSNLIFSTREGAEQRRHVAVEAPEAAGPYLLVNDHPTKHDPEVARRIDALVKQYEARGWTLLVEDEIEAAVRKVLPGGPIDPDTTEAARLRRVLALHDLSGVLHVSAGPGDAPAHERIAVTRIDAPAEAKTAEAAGSQAEDGSTVETPEETASPAGDASSFGPYHFPGGAAATPPRSIAAA